MAVNRIMAWAICDSWIAPPPTGLAVQPHYWGEGFQQLEPCAFNEFDRMASIHNDEVHLASVDVTKTILRTNGSHGYGRVGLLLCATANAWC
jgi:hypothetical protein